MDEAVAERMPATAASDVETFASLDERTFPRVYAYVPLDDVARVAVEVTEVTNRDGGFVLSSSVDTGQDGGGGDFSLRIPANRLRPALRDLAELAPVIRQTKEGRDVTRRYVTVRDRLEAARAERRGLLRRLAGADTDQEAEAIRRPLDLVAVALLALTLPLALIGAAAWLTSAWLRRRRRESALV